MRSSTACDLVGLHKVSAAVKNLEGLDARLEHFQKLDGVRAALQLRGANVKQLTPSDIAEREAVLKLCRLEGHVRQDFNLKLDRPPSLAEAEWLFAWLLRALADASEEADEDQEEEMFQEEEIRKVHGLADGSAYQIILTRGRLRNILTATGWEEKSHGLRRVAGLLAAACDLGDAEAVRLQLAEVAALDTSPDAAPYPSPDDYPDASLDASPGAVPDAAPDASPDASPAANVARVMLASTGGGWLGATASAALFQLMQHPELTHEECDHGRALAYGATAGEAAALRRAYPAKAARYGAVVRATACSPVCWSLQP